MSSAPLPWEEAAQQSTQQAPWEEAAAQSAMPSAASPISAPAIQKPSLPMSRVYLNTGNPVPEQNAADVLKGMAQGVYDVSTPGVAMSILQAKFPQLASKIPLPAGGPLKDLPVKAIAMTGGMALGGLDAEPPPTGVRPAVRPTPEVSVPSTGPTMGSILARHIPIVGKYLRTMDDIQALLGKDAPASTTNVASPKAAPIPETNGVPWGTGGQGPVSLRGKMIPKEPFAEPGMPVPGGKVALPQGPAYGPGRINPPMEAAQSTTVDLHGYDPATRTLKVQFKNGRVYELSGVPQEIYNNYRNAESQGSFYQQQLKGRYDTEYVGSVGKSAGAQVRRALTKKP